MDLGVINWNIANPPNTARIFGRQYEESYFDGAATTPESSKMDVYLTSSAMNHEDRFKITIVPPSDSVLVYLTAGMVLQRLHSALQEPIPSGSWKKLTMAERHNAVKWISKRYPGKDRPNPSGRIRGLLESGNLNDLDSGSLDSKEYRKALNKYVALGKKGDAMTIAQPLDLLGGNARFEGLKLIALTSRMIFELQSTPIAEGEE